MWSCKLRSRSIGLLFLWFYFTIHLVTASSSGICGQKDEVGDLIGNNEGERWPWLASLGFYSGDIWEHKCGASIISKQHLLTSSHCVKNIQVNENKWIARVGDLDLKNNFDDFGVQESKLLEIFTHPKYESDKAYFDISVIRISDIQFSFSVSPICLPSESSKNQDQYKQYGVFLAGWKLDNFTTIEPKMVTTTSLVVYSNKRCNQTYSNFNEKTFLPRLFQDDIMCAGSKNTVDSQCSRDSGGPVFYYDYEILKYIQVGVVSGYFSDEGCLSKSVPSIVGRLDYPENFELINSHLLIKEPKWSEWKIMKGCSKTCGGGTLIIGRTCDTQDVACKGPEKMIIKCNLHACKTGTWSDWTSNSECKSSNTCGEGTQILQRHCQTPDLPCLGRAEVTIKCNLKSCPTSFTKVAVALGKSANGLLNDIEVIDLASPETFCLNLPNFPTKTTDAIGALVSGDNPLICGGEEGSADCFNLKNGTWNSDEPLKQGRWAFTMTKSPFSNDGSKLFILGGFRPRQSSTEVLTANGWQLSTPLPIEIFDHCMVQINQTSVMVVSGITGKINFGRSDQTFVFNSETQLWTEGPKIKIPRNDHACAMIRKDVNSQEKALIIVGGFDSKDFLLTSTEVLESGSNEWRAGPELPFGIGAASMVEDPTGGVVLIGGWNDRFLDTVFQLNHVGRDAEWEEMSQKLKIPRHDHTAFLIPDELANCQADQGPI